MTDYPTVKELTDSLAAKRHNRFVGAPVKWREVKYYFVAYTISEKIALTSFADQILANVILEGVHPVIWLRLEDTSLLVRHILFWEEISADVAAQARKDNYINFESSQENDED